MKIKLFLVWAVFSIIALMCISPAHSTGININKYSIYGQTMGTYYTVEVYTHKKIIPLDLKQTIDVQLKMINQQMSLYSKPSEISKFNRANKDEAIHISNDFFKVITSAQKLYEITDGAWDGTVRPLYRLWNFNKSEELASKIPDPKKIETLLKKTGFGNIVIKENFLKKKISGLNLDLGSIAKGYGVDAIATLLKSSGFKNFFVEIGGEVYAAGQKSQLKKWKVGISMPKKGYSDKPYKILKISDKALATSGTYRNFFELNQKTYSHIINPKTGWPVDNNIVSASVIAENCMLADGLATGLMVMDRQKGVALVNSLDNVECMIVIKEKNEKLKPFYSKGFAKYVAGPVN
ncbi:MAG: FAD:protein FMN transferase [Desulfobacterales bacterium]|nr:FAD:protein FMN transferase [Desulfobacterales bacterium]